MAKKETQVDAKGEVVEQTAPKTEKTSFIVLGANGTPIRTYTVEIHGENAGALAAQFAGKVKGSVV